MRIRLALEGDIRRILAAEAAAGNRAVIRAFRAGAKGLREDLRAHTQGAGLGRLGRAWSFKAYSGRTALDATALVYPKGRSAYRALSAFEEGVTIRPKGARYLAIPTQFNRRGGRRGAKLLFRPDEVPDPFVARSRGGHLLLFARVGRAQRKSRGVVRDLAFADTHLLGSGRIRRSAEILKHGAVPMFILKPQVRIPKRINVAAIAQRWEARVASLVLDYWQAETRRASHG